MDRVYVWQQDARMGLSQSPDNMYCHIHDIDEHQGITPIACSQFGYLHVTALTDGAVCSAPAHWVWGDENRHAAYHTHGHAKSLQVNSPVSHLKKLNDLGVSERSSASVSPQTGISNSFDPQHRNIIGPKVPSSVCTPYDHTSPHQAWLYWLSCPQGRSSSSISICH